MTTMPTRRAVLPFLVPVVLLLTAAGVEAQEDKWSFVLTPQVWVSHIAENGLVAPNTFGGLQIFFTGKAEVPFTAGKTTAVDSVDPQWGLQLAAQKGRWSLAGSFQYVTFETQTDLFYTPSTPLPCCFETFFKTFPGDRIGQEFVNTTRMDMDFAASYLFPDVVPHLLDVSVGGGIKFIYVSSSRQYGNLSPWGTELGTTLPAIFNKPGSGLYLVCQSDDCSDAQYKDRVKTKSWLYGATIPMSAIFHLTDDGKFLLPLSITPFLGAETRDDQNVVYALNLPAHSTGASPLFGATVKRLDGTTFAYGVTGDATVRWIINDTLSVYAGMRVQFIEGHQTYLAWGPLLGLSARFGGK
jgi:hypothetical protein